MLQAKHHVSTKLALYSHDLKSVLIMRYPARGVNGLPGGHVDADETPDETMKRELMEELTVSVENMKRVDFFLHKGNRGRIILGYTAIAPANLAMVPTDPGYEYGEWISREDFENVTMVPEYRRFILENWPK